MCARVAMTFLLLAMVLMTGPPACRADVPASRKPNILLIVADDMGYADLGCYGGEIKTPHIDSLAASGMRATNFYVAPTCSPSRSMMLTGTDNHIAGMGNMAEWSGPTQRGRPGYEGFLNSRVVTVATLLRAADYHTYMAGKWHLGEKPDEWPARRGFERDFSLLQGAGSHWADMQGLSPSDPRLTYTLNGRKLDKLPSGYYSSKNFTDFIMQSIDEQRADGKPFFAYLAFQAPHGPLAVPDDWREKYKGRYDKGYDVLRAERLARQKRLGITGKDVVGYPRLPSIPAWDTLTAEQRRQTALKMELYAAMLEYMDDQVGRLIAHLKQIGQYDNTVIVFISDNGASGEDLAELVSQISPTSHDWFVKTFDNRPENWGRPGSCMEYGPAWAQVSSVPLRLFKGYEAEGGIRAPLIVSGPGVQHRGSINSSVLHVMDLTPTFLELAGAVHPSATGKTSLAPLQGRSMWPLLRGTETAIRGDKDWLGWEMFGNRAIRQGAWKLLYLMKGAGGSGAWQLFDLVSDPGETNDLAAGHPEKRAALAKLWDEYVKQNGVVVTGDGPFSPRKH